MATYKVLYWQEIPSQIQAEDDSEEIKLPLPMKFTERIDAAAMQRGLLGADDFLAQWNWGEECERPGSAQEVAAAVQAEFEAQFK